MPSPVLYFTYLAVMAGGLYCFVQAWRHRLDTPVHKRWGLAGTGLSLGGIVVVLLGSWLLGWRVNERWPEVVSFHRSVAYAGVGLLLLVAITGLLRIPLHTRLYLVFFPVYVVVLVTAALGYRP